MWIVKCTVKHKNICVFTDTMKTCHICLRRADEMWSFLLSFSCSVLSVCHPMEGNAPGFPILHHLLDFAQTHVHWVSDAIQPSHLPLSSSPPAFNLFQLQDLFQWISSSHQVAKVLQLQLQHQSFQWIFRTNLIYNWLVWSPCSPRYSPESSPTPQFKTISSSVLNLLYGPILTFIHDYWKTIPLTA